MTVFVPVAPLLRYLRIRYPDDDHTETWYAAQMGVPRKTLTKWRERGLDWKHADRMAVHVMNTVPCLVWPEWCQAADAAVAAKAKRHKAYYREDAA